MMRSLWAGVSGLQAHQIAMDVEGNNIANVNTAGFKYSRANFSDMLSQTSKIATAPQGELGGKNAMQIGLGTQISSVTKIFKQGSVQTTDKNTDLAIQGDGFFVVSPDGGSTYKYTRNGDFNFDASGNFTDSNGYIIQGWIRDDDTGDIDATTPIGNITIPPGLTTPAQDTSYITLKANLNSGDTIINKSTIYSLDSNAGWVDTDGDGILSTAKNENHSETLDEPIFDSDQNIYEKGTDFGTLFNASGESLSLEEGQGIWSSFANATLDMYAVDSAVGDVSFDLNGETISLSLINANSADNAADIASAINRVSDVTGISASSNSNGVVSLINRNDSGTKADTKNISFRADGASGLSADALGTAAPDIKIITAFQYQYTKDAATYSSTDSEAIRMFNTTEDLRNFLQLDARNKTDYLANGNDTTAEQTLNKNDGVEVTVNTEGQFTINNPALDAFNGDDSDYWDSSATNEYDANDTLILSGTSESFLEGAAIGGIDIPASGQYAITLSEGTIIPSDLAEEINIINGAQVDAYDIAGTIETGDAYSVDIGALPTISYTVLNTDTTAEDIATGLLAAINAVPAALAIVTPTIQGGKLILTAVNPAAAFTSSTGVTNRGDVLSSAATTNNDTEVLPEAQIEYSVFSADGTTLWNNGVDTLTWDDGAGNNVILNPGDVANNATEDVVGAALAAAINTDLTTGALYTANYDSALNRLIVTADTVGTAAAFTGTTTLTAGYAGGVTTTQATDNAAVDGVAATETVTITAAAAGIDAGDIYSFDINDGTNTQTFSYTSVRDDSLLNIITQLETLLNADTTLYSGLGVSVTADTLAGTLIIEANYGTDATDADAAPMNISLLATTNTTPDVQTFALDTGTSSGVGSNPAGNAVSIVDGQYVMQQDFSFDNTTVGITETTLNSSSFIAGENGIDINSTSGNITLGNALDRPLEFTGGTIINGGFTLPEGVIITIPVGTTITNADLTTDPFVGNVDTDGIVTTSIVVSTIVSATNTVADIALTNTQLESASFRIDEEKSLTLPVGTRLDVDQSETSTGFVTIPAGVNYIDDNDYDMNITVTSTTETKSANTKLATILSAMQGSLPSDGTGRVSQALYSATHASSIDVYDSLGTKHTVRFEFRKDSVTTEGTQWDVKLSVPKPGVINPTDTDNYNVLTGTIKFGADGSLDYFTPTSISYTANNGSAPDQNILIDLGTIGQFDGMTSFDSNSNTSGISQDGYTGGDLSGVRIDETGTVIGSFTNGRSFGLAQVSMASFSNDEGLESDGGNTFIQTSNSGDPIIGQAAVGGRGFIQASALEMSNVDLSRSLTQLIVVQRGFQANSKTITTSDQMLNTLLQLKQ